MAAGTHYDLKPDYKPEEFYRVDTGVRKSGPWKLDITNLVVGSYLPVFTPVEADLKKRTLVPVRNVKPTQPEMLILPSRWQKTLWLIRGCSLEAERRVQK